MNVLSSINFFIDINYISFIVIKQHNYGIFMTNLKKATNELKQLLQKAKNTKYIRRYKKGGKWVYIYKESDKKPSLKMGSLYKNSFKNLYFYGFNERFGEIAKTNEIAKIKSFKFDYKKKFRLNLA